MDISAKGLSLLTQWEGFVPHMYHDSAGLPSIGVGHCLTNTEKVSGYIMINGVHTDWTEGLTDDQVQALLHQDCQVAVSAVNESVKIEVVQDQFDALCSLTFNIGAGAFASSTVLKRVNAQDFNDVPDAFRMWNKAGGKVDQGLVERREKEIQLWKGEV